MCVCVCVCVYKQLIDLQVLGRDAPFFLRLLVVIVDCDGINDTFGRAYISLSNTAFPDMLSIYCRILHLILPRH